MVSVNMAVNVFRRMTGNTVGYVGVPGLVTYYYGWLRESMSQALATELDPMAVGGALGTMAAIGTGATLEHRQSRLRDGLQRGLARTAGLALGAGGGAVANARAGKSWVSGAVEGGLAGYVSADLTSRAAPYWGNLTAERTEEAAAAKRP